MREGLINSNVVIATNKNHEGGGRERVLSDDELRAVWTATSGGDQHSAVVRLLLLTGARRDEIGGLKWDEIDFDDAMISLPGERTKTPNCSISRLRPLPSRSSRRSRVETVRSSLGGDKAGSAAGPRAKRSLTSARKLRPGACTICAERSQQSCTTA
jgi:integrase